MSDLVEEFSAFEMSVQRDVRCDRCRYWELDYIAAVFHGHHDDDCYGECHYSAPSPVMEVLRKIGDSLGSIAWATEETANIKHNAEGDNGGSSKTVDYTFEGKDVYEIGTWPRTRGVDWCGRFSSLLPELLAERNALLEKHRAEVKAKDNA
jgi:hypothetical protein